MAERTSVHASMARVASGIAARLTVALALAGVPLLAAQQHTARRLGHPSTRFAEPVQTPEELRERLNSEALRSDVDLVLNLCDNWDGNLEDFRAAVATAPITSLQIPSGTRLAAMSSRKGGRPIVLRNVLWVGEEPIDAFQFAFYSEGREYRCTIPKVCCNFWIENVGPDTRQPALALECAAPEEVRLGHPVEVCLTVKNTGEVPEKLVTLTLPIPEGATFSGPQASSNPGARRLVWRFSDLGPGQSKQYCAEFVSPTPTTLTFASTAVGTVAQEVGCECTSRVAGLAAVLLEVIDIDDPIEVGKSNTYDICVTNQGTSTLTGLRPVFTLEESQEFVSGSGASPVVAAGRTLTCEPLAELAPKSEAHWRVVVKALAVGDVRFHASLTGDQCEREVEETESTRQY